MYIISCQATNLSFDHSTSGGFQNFTFSASRFDGFASRLGESMSLNGDVLGSEFFPSNHNLVDIILGLVDGLGFGKRID